MARKSTLTCTYAYQGGNAEVGYRQGSVRGHCVHVRGNVVLMHSFMRRLGFWTWSKTVRNLSAQPWQPRGWDGLAAHDWLKFGGWVATTHSSRTLHMRARLFRTLSTVSVHVFSKVQDRKRMTCVNCAIFTA
jgi:hypothetical protein